MIRDEGLSLLAIARMMHEEGRSAPSGGMRRHSETVRRALAAPLLESLMPAGGGYCYAV